MRILKDQTKKVNNQKREKRTKKKEQERSKTKIINKVACKMQYVAYTIKQETKLNERYDS